jgi:lipoprotein-releasing system permease protein
VRSGGSGTGLGGRAGVVGCRALRWFGLRLDPEVYYLERLPVEVNAPDYLLVALAAMFITILATIYPALAASRLRPVDGIRYE